MESLALRPTVDLDALRLRPHSMLHTSCVECVGRVGVERNTWRFWCALALALSWFGLGRLPRSWRGVIRLKPGAAASHGVCS